jgi:hypothetical protein
MDYYGFQPTAIKIQINNTNILKIDITSTRTIGLELPNGLFMKISYSGLSRGGYNIFNLRLITAILSQL